MKTAVARVFFLEKKEPFPHPSHILNQKTRGLGRTHRVQQMEGWSRETLQNIDVRQQNHQQTFDIHGFFPAQQKAILQRGDAMECEHCQMRPYRPSAVAERGHVGTRFVLAGEGGGGGDIRGHYRNRTRKKHENFARWCVTVCERKVLTGSIRICSLLSKSKIEVKVQNSSS